MVKWFIHWFQEKPSLDFQSKYTIFLSFPYLFQTQWVNSMSSPSRKWRVVQTNIWEDIFAHWGSVLSKSSDGIFRNGMVHGQNLICAHFWHMSDRLYRNRKSHEIRGCLEAILWVLGLIYTGLIISYPKGGVKILKIFRSKE